MSDDDSNPAFVFAGGGTGGHIFPALAIAEQVVAARPGARCTFVCSTRELDAEILRAERIGGRAAEYFALGARPFGLGPRTLARFVFNWGSSLRASREYLRGVRATNRNVTLVAMGGFVAAPMAQAARVERIPIALVNLDAVPGRANRWIASRAGRVFTSAPLSDRAPAAARRAWSVVPPIVRAAAVCTDTPERCREMMGLDAGKPVLLVTGASQGAGSINEMMTAFVKRRPEALRGWQVIHQTGKVGVEAVRGAYAEAGVPAVVEGFFREMGRAWRAAECAVSRAGAGSVAEAWANGVPTLFLPYPYHKDEHQKYNAAPLVAAGAGRLERDAIGAEANLARAGVALGEMLTDAACRNGMRKCFESLGPADGARRVADAILHENRGISGTSR